MQREETASTVSQAQPLSVFDEPEANSVLVTLHGSHDPSFLRFTQQIPLDDWEVMPVEYLETVDGMRRRLRTAELDMETVQEMIGARLAERSTDGHLRPHAQYLARLPLAERRQFGAEGLKDQIVEAIGRNEPAGLGLGELLDLFPDIPQSRMTSLLNGMRDERVALQGERRWARWHTVARGPDDEQRTPDEADEAL